MRLPGEGSIQLHLGDERIREAAARRYAKDASNEGLRVEAGTLPEIRPEVHI
jgi:hypothetical protein